MIIFFIRRYNDVDHVVPVIYKALKENKNFIAVLCLNPNLDIENDFRLKYLKNQFNVTIDYVYNFYKPSCIHKILSKIICQPLNNDSILFKIINKIVRRFFWEVIYENLVKQKYYDVKWVKELLIKYNVYVLVFDHIKNEHYIAGTILKGANELNIKTVGLPHGTWIFTENVNYIWNNESTSLDYMIVNNNEWKKILIKQGISEEKITVIGSSRYCEEWLEVLYKILPEDNELKNKSQNKIKVVYMERGADLHGEYENIIIETLNKISKLDFVHLIIKPPTRSNKLHFNLSKDIDIAYDNNSVNLIKWADVVIGTVSSILVEVLCQYKILLYPKYFHNEETIFERMQACYNVNNYQELEDILKNLKKIKAEYRELKGKNIREFLTNTVYGGIEKRDVLDDYLNFIKSKKQE